MGQTGRYWRSCVLLSALLTGLASRVYAAEATLIADAHVDMARPTVNAGGLSNVNVGAGYTGLMQFDLSLLPAGTTAAQVSRAVLRLYVNRVDTPGLVSLQPVSGSWSEYAVTSATLPPLGSAAAIFSVNQAGAYVALDVTTLVQGWVTTPTSNHGFALTAGTAALQLDSKENDQTAHAASLDITIVSQGPPGATGAAGPAGPSGPAGQAGVMGLTGAPGPAGPAGPAGAPGASTVTGFDYQGAYSSTANYALDDVVVFQGSSYVSLVASNHGNSPGSSPLQWGLLAQGTTSDVSSGSSTSLYQGAYLSTANYGLNDLVSYQGATYISLQTGNHGNLPSSTSSYWGILGQGTAGPAGAQGAPGLVYQGTYSSTTNYGLGDVVTYQGSSYVSLAGSNAGNTPGFSGAPWGVLAAGYAGVTTAPAGNPTVAVSYQGTYASTTNYALNDIVLYGASSYISLIAQNHGNTPGLSPAQWGLLAEGGTGIGPAGPAGATGPQGPQGVPGLGYAGTYASTTNYGLSDVVGYQGSSYISLVARNHGNTPDQSPALWGLLAQGGTGPAGATGAVGPAGPQGLPGLQGPQGVTGLPGATGPVGPQGLPGLTYQGIYQSTTNYNLGDVVLWRGTTYTSLIGQNHGNTPDASPSEWGVLSAQGPVGPAGATGATGAQGPQGLPGSVGPPGEQGPQGAQGIAGQAGARGLTGATGAQGLQGPAGPQGIAGPVGLTFRGAYQSTVNYALADGVMYGGAGYVSLMDHNAGNTPDQSPSAWALFAAAGAAGAVGAAGAPGATGAIGPQGPAGQQGAQGVAGATGPQGPPVVNYTGNYSSASNYGMRDAVSYGGSTYVSLVDGNRGNTPGLSAGAWAVLAAQGAAGAQGLAGPSGAAGAPGMMGAAGPQGATGPPMTFLGGWLVGTSYPVGAGVSYGGSSYVALAANVGREPDVSPQYWGLQAAAGAAGPAGATGATGPTGPTGYPGPAGPVGATGAAGAQGPVGPAGAAGASGATGPAGPQGVAGPVGLTYRGAYAAGTTYAANDAATYAGSTYLSLAAANRGNEPDMSPSQWALLAPAGAAGATGAAGAVGPQGPSGPAGPVGAAGAMGATGATGVTFRGVWSSVTSYQVRDAVLFGGTSYYATAATTGLEPDQYPAAWSVLAAGSVGPAGPSGASATVAVGSVTTGAAGTQATVTNTGTNTAAVLNFSIPQGVAGANGGGGGGTAQPLSGIPFVSTYHSVSYNAGYYSVNGSASAYTETPGVLTWVPGSCTANRIVVFSEQENAITVSLRIGPSPGAMANAGLSCTVNQGTSCTGTASVAVSAGSFVDFGVSGSSGNAGAVWTALECD